MALKSLDEMTEEERAAAAGAPSVDLSAGGFASSLPSVPKELRSAEGWKDALKGLVDKPGETATAAIVGGANSLTKLPLLSDALSSINQTLNAKGRRLPLVGDVLSRPLLPLAGAAFADKGESGLEAAGRWSEAIRNLAKEHPVATEFGEGVAPLAVRALMQLPGQKAARVERAFPKQDVARKADQMAEEMRTNPAHPVYKYNTDPAIRAAADDRFKVGQREASWRRALEQKDEYGFAEPKGSAAPLGPKMPAEPSTTELAAPKTVNERRGPSRDFETTAAIEAIRRLIRERE